MSLHKSRLSDIFRVAYFVISVRILSVLKSLQSIGAKSPMVVGNQNLSLTLQPIVRM